MALSLEELIINKRIALKYLILRESRRLFFGKKAINKKISHFVRHHQESSVWTTFMDSLNEDLTRNINVFDWRFKNTALDQKPQYFVTLISEGTLRSFEIAAM